MKAVVLHKAGDLRIEERQEGPPGPGEVKVRIAAGGVCGTDLHYYNHGGFGSVALREPMILGHEVAGHVAAVGPGVEGLAPGDLVAVSPSRPCGDCRFCADGLHIHCPDMRFYGSAMPFPHIQGAFREELVAGASQCVKADGLSAGEAAMAEPLSVCLHATRRAGELKGKRVLVTGCGPIGVLSILAARWAGAVEIAATDLVGNALKHATAAGADRVIDVSEAPDGLEEYTAGKGYFDLLYECTGSQAALSGAIPAMRPRAVVMQLGLGGDMRVPMVEITVKELDLRGSFRFHEEFETAVRLMQSGAIDVKAAITHTLPLEEAELAFRIANDRRRAMKTQIALPEVREHGLQFRRKPVIVCPPPALPPRTHTRNRSTHRESRCLGP